MKSRTLNQIFYYQINQLTRIIGAPLSAAPQNLIYTGLCSTIILKYDEKHGGYDNKNGINQKKMYNRKTNVSRCRKRFHIQKTRLTIYEEEIAMGENLKNYSIPMTLEKHFEDLAKIIRQYKKFIVYGCF